MTDFDRLIAEIRLTNNGRLRRVAMPTDLIPVADAAAAAGLVTKYRDTSDAALRCPSADLTCYTERAKA